VNDEALAQWGAVAPKINKKMQQETSTRLNFIVFAVVYGADCGGGVGSLMHRRHSSRQIASFNVLNKQRFSC
jgi:hypothetical protein